MTEIECLQATGVSADVIALKVPGLDAERHVVVMHAAANTEEAAI
jgi:hypothetical protein